MLALSLAVLIGLPAVVARYFEGNGQQPITIDNQPDFIPFSQFLPQVQHANFTEYNDTAVLSEAEFQRMQSHVLYMYEGVHDRDSVRVDYVDCIAIREQPTYYHLKLGHIEQPPNVTSRGEREGHDTPGPSRSADSPLKLGLKDRFGNPISCKPGYIPMKRLTLEYLTNFTTLNDFFSKGRGGPGRERPNPQGVEWDVHKWASAFQQVENFGGNSWINLWSPKANFSLSQHWYVGGSGCSTQTVEGGWEVGSWWPTNGQAVLFIYWTNHNYNLSGCQTTEMYGCYNLDCPGFAQLNNNWYIGGIWDHYSTINGDQWGFEMQWKLYKDKWWLFLRGRGEYEAVGFYPSSIYKGGQIAHNASLVAYGGEASRMKDGSPFPPMGSGKFPSDGWSRAAFQNTIFWIPRDENDGVGEWTKLGLESKTPGCYDINITNFPAGGDWGTYIYFGGPGGTC
ncbi:hypothetical protein NA57DRAFT_32918 [Rhizodiscina lignyota]|uniref:Neprosin PEP catalytic domain-containing protein n=1 Tax=Rhizodiscina lignyota TaxID=1504668 RepID=A0A9P4M9X0_9PEZI|nr:hypothetical protein NA57DRAFT_32918 [Rhizodiscina lignyota]